MGVSPNKVSLAHSDPSGKDVAYQRKMLDRGVWLEFDMIGLDITFPKEGIAPGVQETADAVAHLIELGYASLFKILCKCLFSEVTVQAVTELDNKAAHCHSPVLQRHRPFPGRRLDCQPHHFFHRVVCREHFTLFDRMADHAV